MDIDATIIIQMLLFLVTLVVLSHALMKPVMAVLEARHQRIEGAGIEAERLVRLADENRDAYLSRIRDARKVAGREREQLLQLGNDEKRKLLAEVRAELATELAHAREQVHAAESQARQALAQDTDAMAKNLVARMLGQKL